MTEAELQAAVLGLARLSGWRVFHARPAQTKKGWRTAVAGDGTGYPDLTLVCGRLLFVELKSATGELRREQEEWVTALEAAGCELYVWTPAEWADGTVEKTLFARERPGPRPLAQLLEVAGRKGYMSPVEREILDGAVDYLGAR